jgi:hypothetical protein
MTTELAGRAVLTVPSTYVQARLDFATEQLAFADEPAGYGVHAVLDGTLVSHIQPVALVRGVMRAFEVRYEQTTLRLRVVLTVLTEPLALRWRVVSRTL